MQDQADVEEAVKQAMAEMCKHRPMTAERCQPMMKRIKVIAKRSDHNVESVFSALWDALSHGSQKRVASLMLCEVLFSRSKKFRQLLTHRFPDFIEAVVAPGKTLPAPQEFAERLRVQALNLISTWTSSYGSLYPQLGVAAKYLRGLELLAPDPNEATPTANQQPSTTNAAEEQQQSEQQASINSFVCDAKNARESATTCLQCNVMLLHWLKIPIPENLRWIVENPNQTTSTQKTAHVHVDDASETQAWAVDPDHATSGDLDESFQFEDVEWDPADDDALGVMDPEPGGKSYQPSGTRRKLPDSIWQAVAETLREGQRSIQKVHLPRLHELLFRDAGALAHAAKAQRSVSTAPAVQDRMSEVLQLQGQLKQLQEAAVAVCQLLITQQDIQEALSGPAGGTEEPGTAGCGHQRTLRGRNERLWPEAPPRPVQASAIRDPAAPVVGNPWTLSFNRVGAPQSQAVLRTPATATSVKGDTTSDTQPGEPSAADTAEGDGAAVQASTIKPGALESILKKAPKLPAGPYLKLWESPDVQREYLQQHMTQGQMHSHWGRVDDVVNLDASQIENMLASCAVYHDVVSSRKRKAEAGTKRTEGPEDTKMRKLGTSHATEETDAHSNVDKHSTVAEPGEESSTPVVESAKVKRNTNQGQHLELQAEGMSQKERTAAAREHNKRVLAAAGLAAVGREETLDGSSTEGQVQKKKKSGGAVKKLEKMMSRKK